MPGPRQWRIRPAIQGLGGAARHRQQPCGDGVIATNPTTRSWRRMKRGAATTSPLPLIGEQVQRRINCGAAVRPWASKRRARWRAPGHASMPIGHGGSAATGASGLPCATAGGTSSGRPARFTSRTARPLSSWPDRCRCGNRHGLPFALGGQWAFGGCYAREAVPVSFARDALSLASRPRVFMPSAADIPTPMTTEIPQSSGVKNPAATSSVTMP